MIVDLCREKNYAFLEHSDIDAKKRLNTSQVHLNKVGDYISQNNLLRALNF